jgi:glycosyltransferase involved in cell wall biosynthesis
MGNKRSIDILLATYNGQKYLREQVDSILAQSNQDWQLLIRDDASDDDTLSIIKDYVAKYSDRVKLIEDDGCHLGASLNFQRLLENSAAEYIMFSDQDDVWLPLKIEATLNLMKSTEKECPNKPILVHTDLIVVDSRLNTIAKSTWKYQGISPEIGNDPNKVIFQNVATGCTIMINRKAKTISLPIPKEAVMHDWWLAINVAKYGKIVYVPDQLVLYRQHSNNLVGAKQAPKITIWLFLSNLFSLKKRILNHYRMVKKYDPNATFWSVVLKKIASKIAHICR